MIKELTLDEIKQIELDLLFEFDKFCIENSLHYSLAGGTLLGAIRHKGFIPWDDDIDLMMPRPDYDKMIYLLKYYELPEHIGFICGDNGSFQNPYARFVDLRTGYEGKYAYDHLWIDIFPVDGLPDSYEKSEWIYRCVNILKKMLKLSCANLNEGHTKMKSLMRLVQPLFKIAGTKNFCKALEKIARRYDYLDCQYVGSIVWGVCVDGERMKKEEFEEQISVEFAGNEFPAMSCWDRYLSGLYGEYMIPTPPDKRVVHAVKAWIELPEKEEAWM